MLSDTVTVRNLSEESGAPSEVYENGPDHSTITKVDESCPGKFFTEVKMKTVTYCGLFFLLAFLYLPTTADAFSRRSHQSEVPVQNTTVPLRTSSIDGNDASAQAVPEPPVLLLMTIGLGVVALGSAIRRFRKVR